ncbi:MAG: tol-pal system protein YbgF [Rhodocyclales bacterium GWA2_65_20]|nr:MAG: tol-pal system protein YbgF [Rhodocyclales bacterium GWA2_65_20]
MMRAGVVALVAVLGLAALPARAGLFDDEEARAKITKLSTDFDELAKRIDVAAKNQLDFANQAEVLKSEVAKLRGQIEVMVNDIETTQKRQKDFYVDLDSRLRKIEAGLAEAKPEAQAEAPKADPASEMRDYEAALTAFKGAKYKEALAAFQSFIKAYPSSSLLPSAHYWAASSHYQLKDYGNAAELFGHLAGTWPNDTKAPDALLAAANAQIEGGDAKSGRRTLEALIEKYPASSVAPAAKSRLKRLLPPRKK